jgi:hypothetical protein
MLNDHDADRLPFDKKRNAEPHGRRTADKLHLSGCAKFGVCGFVTQE